MASGRKRVVVFTAGGNAAGKSSTIKPGGGAADIVFDSTLSNLDPSAANIERALAAGRDVAIRYIWRDPVKALTDGALPRAMGEGHGRVVTVRGLAGTHIGSRRALLRLVETYAGDPRVTVFIYSNIEMSTLVPLTVDALKARTYDDRDALEGQLFDALDAAQTAGAVSDIVWRAATGLHRRVEGDRG